MFVELKRRNVIRVLVLYGIVSWLVMQIVDVILPHLFLPEWTPRLVLLLLAIGLPVALIFAWAYEITPEGIKKEKEVDRSESIAYDTGRRIDFMIIGVLTIALGYFAFNHDWAGNSEQGSSPAEESQPGDESSAAAGGDPATTADNRKSIAVLPFANLSDNQENAYFASGVHEDILTYLSRVNDLRVISRTSVLKYDNNDKNLRAIADELGVDHIVEGSVRRSGDRVRITAQLIDANVDEHLWADNYDRDLTDVFAIQTEVAQAIVAALEAELSDEEQQRIALKPTNNVGAYDEYLKARDILHGPQYALGKYEAAEPYLHKAIDLDAEFALAHLMLAEVYGQYFWLNSDRSADRAAMARAEIQKAASVDPDSPDVAMAMGEYYYRFEFDYERALAEHRKAQRGMPNNAELYSRLGFTLRRANRWEESIDAFAEATKLDPGSLYYPTNRIGTLLKMRRYDDVLVEADAILEKYPRDGSVLARKASAYLYKTGDLDGAIEMWRTANPADDNIYRGTGVVLLLYKRDFDGIVALMESPGYKENSITRGALSVNNASVLSARFLLRPDEEQREIIRQLHDENLALYDPFDNSWGHRIALANGYSFLGNHDAAIAMAREASNIIPESRDALDGVNASIALAVVLGRAGQSDEAIDILERLIQIPDGPTVIDLKLGPSWDMLRDNPRFQALVAE
jgi:TolB-like protein/Flp pilus assembly protein TadD